MPRATRPSTARVVRDHERRGSPPTSGGPRSAVRSKWADSVSNSGQIQMSVITGPPPGPLDHLPGAVGAQSCTGLFAGQLHEHQLGLGHRPDPVVVLCLLYTSDAADDLLCVDLGGRRIIKKK